MANGAMLGRLTGRTPLAFYWIVFVQFGFIVRHIDAGATCAGDLYYFAQQGNDNREIYTRLKAPNVNDCVRKCYADDFCFSAVFAPKTAPEEADCLLSYISGFNCTRKQLTNTYNDNTQTATLECLRCPQNGEFVTPPPISFPNEGGSTAPGDLTPTPAELTTTPLAGSTGAPSIDATPETGSKATDVPVPSESTTPGAETTTTPEATTETTTSGSGSSPEPTANTTITFETVPAQLQQDYNFTERITTSSARQCAEYCFSQKCLAAGFVPAEANETGTCLLTFQNQPTCGQNGATRVSEYTNPEAVGIQCIQSGIDTNIDQPATSVTVPQGGYEQGGTYGTPQNSDISSTPASEVTSPPPPCNTNLSFELTTSESDSQLNFTDHITVSSMKECAQLCYQQQCVLAGFVPPQGNDPGSCLLTNQGSAQCDRWGVDRVQDYTGENITHIQCVRCEPGENIEGPPTSVTKEPTRVCPQTVTFEVHHPAAEEPSFESIVETDSAADCARICYERSCALAGYAPPEPDLNVTRGSCLMSFSGEGIPCGNGSMTAGEIIGPVTLSCVQCGTGIPETTPPGEDTQSIAPVNASRACLSGLTFSAKPSSSASSNVTQQFATGTAAKDAQECADMCFAKRCALAHYSEPMLPNSMGTCLISLTAVAVDGVGESCESAQAAETFQSTDSVDIDCVRCATPASTEPTTLAEPILLPPSGNETSGNDTSVETTTAGPTEAPIGITTPGTCEGTVTYESVIPDPSLINTINFTDKETVQSVKDCANLCYQRKCAVAGYTPPILNEAAACVMAYDNTQAPACGINPGQQGNDSQVVQIQCVQCAAGGASVVEATPGVATQGPETTPETTTLGGTQMPETRQCSAAITFEVRPPETAVASVVNFTNVENVTTAADCAKQCFDKGCVIAGYTPSEITGSSQCFMAFVDNIADCGQVNRSDSYTGTSMVELHCLECSGEESIDVTPTSATNAPDVVSVEPNATTVPLSPVRKCVGNLTFIAEQNPAASLSSIAKNTLVSSAHSCAMECYAHGCSKAIFRPENFHPSEIESSNNLAPCQLSFDNVESCDGGTKVSDVDFAGQTVITCADCSEATPVLLPSENGTSANETVGATTVEVETTTVVTPEVPVVNATSETSTELPPGVHIVPPAGEPCQSALTFEIVQPNTETSSSNFTDAVNSTSVVECARQCYERRCTAAGFAPGSNSDQGTCLLSFLGSPTCGRAAKVESYNESTIIEIHCVQCGGTGQAIEPTPQTVTQPPVEVTTGGELCQRALTFEVVQPDLTSTSNFTEGVNSTTVADCARQCYERRCTRAAWTPGLTALPCLLSFLGSPTCGRAAKVESYNEDGIVEIHCVQCGGTGQEIEPTPQTVTQPPVEVTTGGTPGLVAMVRHCVGNVSFVAEPGLSTNLTSVAKTTTVATAKECAMECYAHGCTKAVFRPETFHPSEIETNAGVPCLLSFDSVETCDDFSIVRQQDGDSSETSVISCVTCSLAEPVLLPVDNTTSENATGTTIGEAIEATPISVTAGVVEVTPSAEVTNGFTPIVSSNFTETQRCVGNVSFVALPLTTAPANVVKSTYVISPMGCALECFNHGCTQAVFRPANFHVSEVDEAVSGIPCLLSFDPIPCPADYVKLNDANSSESYLISCIDCSNSIPVVLPPVIGTNDNASADTTTVAPPTEGITVNDTVTEAMTTAATIVPDIPINVTISSVVDANVTEVRKCVGNLSFVAAAPRTRRQATTTGATAKTTLVSTPEACAQECYAHGCTRAIYRPSDFHVSEVESGANQVPCLLQFEPATCDSVNRQPSADAAGSYEISCIDCSLATPILIPPIPGENDNATVGETTTAFTTLAPEASTTGNMTEGPRCSGNLTFKSDAPPPSGQPIASMKTTLVSTPEACAQECYAHACTRAIFRPLDFHVSEVDNANDTLVPCLLTTEPMTCENVRLEASADPTGSYSITCLQCSSPSEGTTIGAVIEATPESVTGVGPIEVVPSSNETATTIGGEATTPSGESGTTESLASVRRCSQGLKFQTETTADAPPTNAAKTTLVSTATQCALECYAHGCTRAIYHPAGFHPTEFGAVSGVPCYLTFDPATCSNDSNAKADDTYNTTQPTVISCIDCALAVPILLPASNESSATAVPVESGVTAAPNDTLATSPLPEETAATAIAVSGTTTPSGGEPTFDCPRDVAFLVEVDNGTGPLANANTSTVALSAQACAKECYLHGCSYALFDASELHESEFGAGAGAPCYLSFPPSACIDAPGTRVTAYPANEQKARVAISCVTCPPGPGEGVIDATPESVTKGPVEAIGNESTTIGAVVGEGSTPTPSGGLATIPPFSRDCTDKVTFVPSPVQLVPATATPPVVVRSEQECAMECYRRSNCTSAVFDITDTTHMEGEPCFLYFDEYQCPANVEPVSNYTATLPIQMGCINCASPTVEGATPTDATPIVGGVTEVVPVETAACPIAVTFQARTDLIDEINSANFTMESIPANTAAECARICYNRGCRVAKFTPKIETTDTGACLLSVLQGQCAPDLPHITQRDVGAPSNSTSEPIASSTESGVAATAVGGTCPSVLSFETFTPDLNNALNFTDLHNVTSASECATLCYGKACTGAGYVPPAMPGASALCMLSFVGETVCGRSNRGEDYNGSVPVEMHCVRCGTESAGVIENTPVTAIGGVETTTTVDTSTELPSANNSEPLVSGVFPPSGQEYNVTVNPELMTITPGVFGETTFETTTVDNTSLPSVDVTPIGPVLIQNTTEPVLVEGNTDTTLVVLNGTVELTTVGGVIVEGITVDNGSLPLTTESVVVVAENTTAPVIIEGSTDTTLAVINDTAEVTTVGVVIVDGAGSANVTEAPVGGTTVETGTSSGLVGADTGSGSGTPCPGRVTFQIQEADDGLREKFTDEHPIASAAECARLCYNTTGCQVAAFLQPTETSEQGTCLLSKEAGKCTQDAADVAQAYRGYPFVINCIKCTDCTYNLRAPDQSATPNFETQTDAQSLTDCVQQCSNQNCTSAAYTGRVGKNNCMLATSGTESCQASSEMRLETTAPVLIDCVRCRGGRA